MGNTIRRLYRRLSGLSPETRQVFLGVGLAFDPFPENRYSTFERCDADALSNDWAAVAGDMWWAIDRADKERRGRGD